MLQRTISVRRTGILLLVVLLAAGGLFFLHHYQVQRQLGIYLQSADVAQAAQNHHKAIDYLERYLRLRPQDKETTKQDEQITLGYVRLVDDSARTNPEQARAYLALEKMLRKYPDNPELKRRAALRAKKMMRFRDAEDHLLKLIAPDDSGFIIPDDLKDSPKRKHVEEVLSRCHDVELLEGLAECEKNLAHPNSAAMIYRVIFEHFPAHTGSYLELARLLRDNNQLEEADKLLEEMITKNDGQARAFLALGTFLTESNRAGDEEKAEQALHTALDKNGDALDEILFANAKLATIRGKKKEALSYLQRAMNEFPKQARFYVLAASLEIRQGEEGRKRAQSLLHQALALVNDLSWEQWMIAKVLLDAGDKETAHRLIQTLRTKYGPAALIEYVRGRVLYEEGQLAESVVILESIKSKPELTKFSDIAYETNMVLASAYRQLSNPERSLAAYDAGLKAMPNATSALLAKAEVLGSQGRYGDAVDLLRKLVPAVPSARQSLLRVLIAREFQKAPSERQWNEMETLLDQFSLEEKQSPDVLLLWWMILDATGKTDVLRQSMDQACTVRPQEIRFWLSRIAFEEKQLAGDSATQAKTVEHTLSAAEKQMGDRAELRLVRARRGFTVTDQGQRKRLLDQALQGTDHFSSAEQVTLFYGLGELCRKAGMIDGAKRLYTKVIFLSPRNWDSYYHLLNIAIEEKNDEEVQRLIKTLRGLEGETGVAWRIGTVERFFFFAKSNDRSGLNEVRQLIGELANLRPGWHRTVTLQALLLDLEGDEIAALEQYRKAVELGERRPEVVKRAVQVLMKNRNFEEARRVLDSVIKASETGAVYQKLDTELSLVNQQSSKETLTKARASVKADSKDYRDHLWLGQVLLASGDTRGAEASLRQAVSLGEQDPNTWATWVVYLVKANRRDEADREIKRAEAILKNQPSLISHISIPYFEALGQHDQVEAEYRKLATNDPKDAAVLQNWASFYFRSGEVNKAEDVLSRLTQLTDVNPGITRWTRRSLALALSLKGDYASFRQALTLIEKNLNETGLSPADLNARALIVSSRPGLRRSAIEDLERSFNIQRPNPNEAILLAQLYEDDGKWDRAARVWTDLVSTPEGKKPFYAGFFIRALLRNKKIEEAARQLKELEARAADDPLTIEAKIRVFLAQGKNHSAIELLETQTNRLFNERKDPSVFLASAQILEDAGEGAAAEAHLRRFIAEVGDKKPQAILILVAFLARQGRASEALTLCEENWKRVPAGDMAMAAVATFYYGAPREQEFRRLESRLVELSQGNPSDVRIKLALADLYSQHGDLGRLKAIDIYQNLLSQGNQSANPIVLNNLAWLLSQDSDRLGEAVKLINRAIEQAGPEGSLLDTRGMILLRQNKTADAINDIAEAVSQSPRANRFMHLALAYHRDRRNLEARQAWKKAVSLGLDYGKLPQSERGCYAELASVFKEAQ